MARAWTFLTIEDERQHGGNQGYDDTPERVYRYDSDVANHLRVQSGDLAFIRTRTVVRGMAQIQSVTQAEGPKTRLRCPACGTTTIKKRKTKSPDWRCESGHEFAEPVVEQVTVTTYAATYPDTYVRLVGSVTTEDLKTAAPRPSDQSSIEEVDAAALAAKLSTAGRSATDLLARHFQALQPVEADDAMPSVSDGSNSKSGSGYAPSIVDTRRRLLASITLRRGQAKFRKALVGRYGSSCMISGCSLMEIVEAAHIWPYRGDDDNHPENGLLLRADLHTLFDLDLLGIDPASMRVALHPDVRSAGYGHMSGVELGGCIRHQPSRQALERRWASFAARSGGNPPDGVNSPAPT